MKTALIFFRNLKTYFDGDYYGKVVGAFNSGGLTVDTVEVLSDTDDLGFTRRLTEFKDMFDNLVIVGGDAVRFNLKEIIAQTFDTAIVENEHARNFLDAVSKANGIEYDDSFASLPMESSVIPNIYGGFQGFILDSNELTLSLLPFDYKEIKTMCDKYVLPYLENKLGIKKTRLTLKYFGDIESLENTLKEAENIGEDGFSWITAQKYGDTTLDLLFSYETSEDVKREVVRYIVSNHKDGIYAEYDVSLGERLFDLLQLRGMNVATAESFTGGRVAVEIIKNSGASAVFN